MLFNGKGEIKDKEYLHVAGNYYAPTLKKLMGHIAFGACVRALVHACVTLFVPIITFKPLKLES